MRNVAACLICISVFVEAGAQEPAAWLLPINAPNRQSWDHVHFTKIGEFGLWRKARPQVPAHFHTAVDFMRPHDNYANEPIFPAARGVVISQRDDGPFAQLIIEHPGSDTVWTVYEHIAGVKVVVGDTVVPQRPIARFMTKAELNKFGWQFDHLHFEILKHRPRPLPPTKKTPMRLFQTYSLISYTKTDLEKYYFEPMQFFASRWKATHAASSSAP